MKFLQSLDLFEKWVQSDIKLLNASSKIVEFPANSVGTWTEFNSYATSTERGGGGGKAIAKNQKCKKLPMNHQSNHLLFGFSPLLYLDPPLFTTLLGGCAMY